MCWQNLCLEWSLNTFETILVWFKRVFPERGSNDVAVGLYHPWSLAQKWPRDLGLREWRGIVLSRDICPKVIRWPRSSRMKRDCIILGHLSKIDLVTSVPLNVVGLHHPWTSVQNVSGGLGPHESGGLHHPWTSVQNVSGDLSPRECGKIVSSLNFDSKRIQWTSVIKKVVGLYHPWTSVQNGSNELQSSIRW